MNLHARASAKQMMHNDKCGLKSMGRRCRSNPVLALKSDCYRSALVALHISSVKSVSCHPHMSIIVMIIMILIMINNNNNNNNDNNHKIACVHA